MTELYLRLPKQLTYKSNRGNRNRRSETHSKVNRSDRCDRYGPIARIIYETMTAQPVFTTEQSILDWPSRQNLTSLILQHPCIVACCWKSSGLVRCTGRPGALVVAQDGLAYCGP
ncbi:hypothetical protein AFLA_004827 [Aspergillus flavus NRRL3357]|nr:hypothetical protein AFLA_004827 [Aspergillus flavus NRRL3357]